MHSRKQRKKSVVKEPKESQRQTAPSGPPPVTFDSVFINSLSGSSIVKSEKHKIETKRKNRPGQRARQKLWEGLYGTKARHKRMEKSHAGMKANRKDGTKKQVKEKRAAFSASLHPSWEASKRRKEQESKLASFQGQRTIFSDSD